MALSFFLSHHHEIFLMDAQLVADIIHGTRGEEALGGLHAQVGDHFQVGRIPSTEGVATHATGHGNLKFHLTFHSLLVYY